MVPARIVFFSRHREENSFSFLILYFYLHFEHMLGTAEGGRAQRVLKSTLKVPPSGAEGRFNRTRLVLVRFKNFEGALAPKGFHVDGHRL